MTQDTVGFKYQKTQSQAIRLVKILKKLGFFRKFSIDRGNFIPYNNVE